MGDTSPHMFQLTFQKLLDSGLGEVAIMFLGLCYRQIIFMVYTFIAQPIQLSTNERAGILSVIIDATYLGNRNQYACRLFFVSIET